LINIDITLLFL